MKKQNKFMEFLNSKGFYTALFTCLFAVLAIAAFVSIKNIDAITKLNTVKPAADPTYVEKEPLAADTDLNAINAQTATPIEALTGEQVELMKGEAEIEVPVTTKDGNFDEEPSVVRIKTEVKEPNKPDTESKAEQQTQSGTSNESGQAPAQNKTEVNAVNNSAKEEDNKKDTGVEQKEQEQNTPKTNDESTSSSAAEPQAFADGDKMNWPLDGAIVMNFSHDRTIYDKTLEQYRTNPTVSISAESGTQVKAAADGLVKSINIDPRTGYTVVVDHGGGWETTYGQLQSTVLVKEGQEIMAGQALGGVGNPTKYGVLLGPHLVFGITKDEVPQDPQIVLVK